MVNSIKISTIANATEDEEKVLDAISFFIPDIIDDEDVDLEITETEGCFENPINIFSAKLKNKKAKITYDYIVDMLKQNTKNVEDLKNDLDLRIEKNAIYLRFDKQKAYLNECILSEGDDTVRVLIKFKLFKPSGKEEEVKRLFLERLDSKSVF
ncbi:RNA-binding domain-containing protein [Methanococcus voltae]|uniref:Exosome subunit n=1 Tax=Methanococcus voltae (strain ATCC BAA-1334 / A3) TaxID=456320 RepID=D7DUT6_METV3|nr:RNA-binding domain-containing protein [Methanococcus voltae]MCS3900698.1 RNA binding exosome subunit [Methanococcus voltae]